MAVPAYSCHCWTPGGDAFSCTMKLLRQFLVLGFVVVSNAFSATTAFVDVTVLPMDSDRAVARQTVIVRDDRIAQVGPVASVTVPADAQRIDGAGKFLLPGL